MPNLVIPTKETPLRKKQIPHSKATTQKTKYFSSKSLPNAEIPRTSEGQSSGE